MKIETIQVPVYDVGDIIAITNNTRKRWRKRRGTDAD